jgi:hypothetical protein
MPKEELICGFCKKICETSEDIGFILFPDGQSRPVHLSHVGVKEEWQKQHPKSK